MAHVRKLEQLRRDGSVRVRYQARVRMPDGTERAKNFARERDAKEWSIEQAVDAIHGRLVDPRGSRETVAAWAERWRAIMVGSKPSTAARIDVALRVHVLPAFGSWKLASVDHMAVRAWVAELSASGLAPATVHKSHQVLHGMLDAAVEARVLAGNAADRIPLPTIEQTEMRFLTPEQVVRLSWEMPPRWQAVPIVTAYAGLRAGELAGLRRARVDLEAAHLDVIEIIVEVRGHLHSGTPKTKASRRRIPLPRIAVDALARHMDRWTDPEPSAMVFCGPRGGALRINGWRKRVWKPAVEAAGLAPLRPHDLRHTAVAIWIAAGGHPHEISARAGHTSVAFTLDRYGHLFPGHEQLLNDRIDKISFPAERPEASLFDLDSKRPGR